MANTPAPIIFPSAAEKERGQINKLITIPLEGLRSCRGSFIVKRTTQYCSPKTEGGIVLPGDSEADLVEKKYDIGEVVAIGSEVREIKVGDIVVYARNAAWRLPNGINQAWLFKLEETPAGVICILPPQPMEQRQPFTESEVLASAN